MTQDESLELLAKFGVKVMLNDKPTNPEQAIALTQEYFGKVQELYVKDFSEGWYHSYSELWRELYANRWQLADEQARLEKMRSALSFCRFALAGLDQQNEQVKKARQLAQEAMEFTPHGYTDNVFSQDIYELTVDSPMPTVENPSYSITIREYSAKLEDIV